MRKAILLAVCIMMGAISQLIAQPTNRAGLNTPGVQYLITEYGDELALTDQQKSQLIALQVEYRNERKAENRQMFEERRDDFKRQKHNGRRGGRERGFKKAGPEVMQARTKARMEIRQDVLDILTDEQEGLLQTKMIEKRERAHEFRTFRHQFIVNEAGIEGDKATQVLDLLNNQSANRLELDKQRIQNPAEVDRELFASHFHQVRDTDDELRSLLTVDEYENLRENLGIGNRPDRGARGIQRWRSR